MTVRQHLVVAASVVVLALPGCARPEGPPAAPPATPTATSPVTASPAAPTQEGDPDALLAALEVRGGMCVDGPCGAALTVSRNGDWALTGDGEPERSGTLSGPRLDELAEAVAATALHEAPAFEGTCPVAYDGQEYVVSWTRDGEPVEAASCTVAFPRSDPLLLALTALRDSLA